jgi:casein kinase 1
MQGKPGFANIFWFGVEGEFIILVTNILGPDLLKLFKFSKRKMHLKTVLIIAQ